MVAKWSQIHLKKRRKKQEEKKGLRLMPPTWLLWVEARFWHLLSIDRRIWLELYARCYVGRCLFEFVYKLIPILPVRDSYPQEIQADYDPVGQGRLSSGYQAAPDPVSQG